MVLYHRVRHKYIGSDLASPGYFFLVAFNVFYLFKVFPFLYLNKLGFKHSHGNLTVLVLRTLYLAGNDDSCWNMRQTHCRGGLVNFLPAGAGGSVNVHFNILFTDLHIHVIINFRHNLQRGKRGVASS